MRTTPSTAARPASSSSTGWVDARCCAPPPDSPRQAPRGPRDPARPPAGEHHGPHPVRVLQPGVGRVPGTYVRTPAGHREVGQAPQPRHRAGRGGALGRRRHVRHAVARGRARGPGPRPGRVVRRPRRAPPPRPARRDRGGEPAPCTTAPARTSSPGPVAVRGPSPATCSRSRCSTCGCGCRTASSATGTARVRCRGVPRGVGGRPARTSGTSTRAATSACSRPSSGRPAG